MKKHLFLLLIFIFSSIFAQTEVSTGSFLTFSDSKEAPTYLFANTFGVYSPMKHLSIVEDAELLYGFPKEDGSNMLYTSYSMLRSTTIASYKKSKYLFGSLIAIYFYPGDDDLKQVIAQVSSPYKGKRDFSLRQEVFGTYKITRRFIVKGSAGFDSTTFTTQPLGSNIKPLNPLPETFRDNNAFVEFSTAFFVNKYLIPYAKIEYSDDLNSSSQFDLTTLYGGFSGNIFKDADKRFSYSLFYKGYENDFFREKNRVVLYLKGRKHFSTNTDLFAWFYYEAGYNKTDKKMVYINRNLSLLARQKLFSNTLAISLGTTVLFEKDAINGNFMPLWPFAKVEFEKKYFSAFVYGEVKLPHIYNKNDKQVTAAYQKRVFAGVGYKVWKVKPQLIFLWNKYKKNDAFSGEISQLGIKLQITANM